MLARRVVGAVAVACLLTGCQSDSPDDFGFVPMDTGSGAGPGSGGDDDGEDSDGTGARDATGGTGDDTAGDGLTDDGDESGDGGNGVEPEAAHARGTIVIGESHTVGGSISTPSVLASFVPDYTPAQKCGQMAGGCLVEVPASCVAVCGVGEACGYSSLCQPECQPVCSLPCGVGEVCFFPAVDSAPACKPVDTFDAGPLTLTGTTVPVTLFPPYAYAGVPSGSLFLPGATITADASGSVEAGFDPFSESFQATNYMTTGLLAVDPTVAYGTENVPVTWQPGDDDARVLATVTGTLGASGLLTCVAVDSTGTFDLLRSAINAALDGEVLQSLTITIERRRTTYIAGLQTHGELTEGVIQPDAYLELVTSSSESAAIQNCGTLSWCSGTCVDTTTNVTHCGGCNMPCSGIQTCSLSVCT